MKSKKEVTPQYNYDWTTADEVIAHRTTRRNFPGWGETTLVDIAGSAKVEDFRSAHELWLKLKDAFNAEAATYNKDAYNSKLGSIMEVERREVLRSAWWDTLDGDSYGDYGIITRIIEALHYGEKLETGIILFGS